MCHVSLFQPGGRQSGIKGLTPVSFVPCGEHQMGPRKKPRLSVSVPLVLGMPKSHVIRETVSGAQAPARLPLPIFFLVCFPLW